MKVAMHDVAKKLALWHTPTFRPIITHEELEPILATAGFVPLPTETSSLQIPAPQAAARQAMQWKEYTFRATSASLEAPRPRLPFPRIDGLHLLSYKAFFFALERYMSPIVAHNLFHVRPLPLSRHYDRVLDMSYRPMRDPELDEGIFVYRDGTIDPATMEQITAMELSIAQSEDDANDPRMKKGCSYRTPIVIIPWECIMPKRDTKRTMEQAHQIPIP